MVGDMVREVGQGPQTRGKDCTLRLTESHQSTLSRRMTGTEYLLQGHLCHCKLREHLMLRSHFGLDKMLLISMPMARHPFFCIPRPHHSLLFCLAQFMYLHHMPSRLRNLFVTFLSSILLFVQIKKQAQEVSNLSQITEKTQNQTFYQLFSVLYSRLTQLP